MTENKDDILATEFVLNIITRQDWVTEEILMIYETCYRIAKRMYLNAGQDTTKLDNTRNEIMKLYGQI